MPRNIIFTDMSRNIFDPSYNFISWLENRKLLSHHHWGKKSEDTSGDKLYSDIQKNINIKNFIFSMKLDTILSDMKDLREENYKNISYDNVVKYLDKDPLLLKDKDRKKDWGTWLQNIDKKYSNINLGSLSTLPPPVIPPRPAYTSRSRRRSIYSDGSGLSGLPALLPIPLPGRPPPPPPLKKVTIRVDITSLDDIIQLCKKYPIKVGIEYNINMKAIHNIKEPLTELNNMIGLSNLKLSIMDQILYFIQNLHKTANGHGNDFMHTVIYGPPGTGKTEVAKLMGKIFSKMGVLSKNVFKKATRADLIAGYLGQTALKTKDLIKDCLGGVLFIDEAYALGNPEKRDSFAKECIDTLCEALSDHKDNLMVIIAGYEEELKTCFFDYNQGLDSRFTWRFKTTDYNAEELKSIFKKKVKDVKWDFKEDIPISWFEKHKQYFKFFGRDMETLLAKTKIAHSRRIFCKDKKDRKKLTMKDLEGGFKMYCENNEVKSRKDDNPDISHLYL